MSSPVVPEYRAAYTSQSTIYKEKYEGKPLFFSHYFDIGHVSRMIGALDEFDIVSSGYIRWNRIWLRKMWMAVPQKIRGLLGILNPFISPLLTVSAPVTLTHNWLVAEGDLVLKLIKK